MFFWFSSGSDLKISNKPTSNDVACFLPHIISPSSSFVSFMFWIMVWAKMLKIVSVASMLGAMLIVFICFSLVSEPFGSWFYFNT